MPPDSTGRVSEQLFANSHDVTAEADDVDVDFVLIPSLMSF